MRAALFSVLLALAGCASAPPADVVNQLAPGGKMRAAINLGNPVLAQRGPEGPKGVSVELARELGRKLGVPVELVLYDAAGKVTDAARTGAWDIAFVAIDPKRAQDIEFTAPYVSIDGTYMVREDSPLRAIADFDRSGQRIAVGAKSAYDLFLSRELKHATLVRAPTSPASIELFVSQRLDAAAGVKQPLVEYAKTHAGFRVIDGAFMSIEQAMATPRGRGEAGVRYLKEFVEEMKRSGFVDRAMAR